MLESDQEAVEALAHNNAIDDFFGVFGRWFLRRLSPTRRQIERLIVARLLHAVEESPRLLRVAALMNSPMIELPQAVQRVRGRALLLAPIALVALSIAWAHSGPAMDHMAMDEAVAVCLAISEGFVAAAVVLGAVRARPRWPVPIGAVTVTELPPWTLAPPARAGPAVLQVFRS